MRSYFLRLFDYDHTATQLIYATLHEFHAKPTVTERPMALMAHMLSASQLWLLRCKGATSSGVNIWPKPHWEEMSGQVEANNLGWKAFLEEERNFDRTLTYQNQSGITFSNSLSDILAHVINHGTHHRAQIGQLLRLGGVEKLPVTDYIAYVRSKSTVPH